MKLRFLQNYSLSLNRGRGRERERERPLALEQPMQRKSCHDPKTNGASLQISWIVVAGSIGGLTQRREKRDGGNSEEVYRGRGKKKEGEGKFHNERRKWKKI
jgi:hypothetical protein